MQSLRSIVICAMLVIGCTALAMAVPDPVSDILNRAESAHDWIYHSFTTAVVEEIVQDSEGKGGHIKGTVQRHQDSPQRIHIETSFRQLRSTYAGRGPGNHASEAHYILTDERHAYYGAPAVIVNLARDPERFRRWQRMLHFIPRFGGFLDGWIQTTGSVSGSTVFELARASNSRAADEPELVDGIECIRLDADTSAGHLQIWCAPSRGYNIARIVLKYKGQGGGDFSEYTISVDQVEFQQIDGRWVVVAGRYRAHHVPADPQAPAFDESVTVRRTRVDLQPKFDRDTFSFRIIPDGTMTQVEDDLNSGVQYVWRDGDAVPTVDAKTVAQIRRQVAEQKNKPSADPTMPFPVSSVPPWVSRVGIIVGASLTLLALWLAIERWLLPRVRARHGE